VAAAVQVVGLLLVAVMSPLILSALTQRARRKEKEQDWARQDAREKAERERQEAVATQAAEAARLLRESSNAVAFAAAEVKTQAQEAAQLLVVSNTEVAAALTDSAAQSAEHRSREVETQTHMVSQLTEIHALVNGTMTTSMQNELDSTRREIVALQEIVALKQAAGQPPSSQAIAAIESTRSRIHELETALADRRAQAAVAEAQSG
jgi:hypothetical protein